MQFGEGASWKLQRELVSLPTIEDDDEPLCEQSVSRYGQSGRTLRDGTDAVAFQALCAGLLSFSPSGTETRHRPSV
jgi:hypothetical protein